MEKVVFRIFLISILFFMLTSFNNSSFKEDQQKYPRVRQAYKDKESDMISLLKEKNIRRENLQLYIRAFKKEKEIELWGKNESDEQFQLIKVYTVCRTSGNLGPKRKQGDRQIPEGFYYIDRFNPSSRFYLSLGINYPNTSDKILGEKGNLGGDIFIHGSCVTIGCLPITDLYIKELYILCVEAFNNGQTKIPVTIFPLRLESNAFNRLTELYKLDSDKTNLWADLKKGYDIFNETRKLPSVTFLKSGRHTLADPIN